MPKIIAIHKHPTQEFSYKELIKTSLENPPANGFTTSTMRSRLKILDALDEMNPDSSVLELKDEDYNILLGAIAEVRWAKLDKFIIEFEDTVKNASNKL